MFIRNNLLLPFMALLCVSIFSACVKDPATDQASEEYKEYALFKEGSHWIYHIESSRLPRLEQDSIFAVPPGPKSSFSMFYRSTYLAGDTLTSLSGTQNSVWYQVYSTKNFPLAFVYSYFSGATPGAVFEQNGQKLLYREFLPVKDIYPYSTSLWYTTFRDVKVFEVLTPPADSRLPRVIYWAKNKGIIRKELFNGDTLNLIYAQVQQ